MPFGNATQSGRAYVRLSSMDQTPAAVHPVTFSGLDLQTPDSPPCTSWTLTFVSGRASTDFNIISAGTAEGSGANTPTPSSTGVGHLTGSYVWNVQCAGAAGNSNTVTLTYNIDNAGGAGNATVSEADRLDFGALPSSGFGNNAGAKVTFAVGSDFHNSCTLFRTGGAFTNQVTFEYADPTRPAYLSNFTTGGFVSNILVHDLILSGPRPSGCTNITGSTPGTGASLTNIAWDNINYYGAYAWLGNIGTDVGLTLGCASGPCSYTNSYFEYVPACLVPSSNMTLTGYVCRYFYNNALFWFPVKDVDMEDDMFLSPMKQVTRNPFHVDVSQIADGLSAGPNIQLRRILIDDADGNSVMQGLSFEGSTIRDYSVYVDDGTAGHGAGNIVTLVGGGSLPSNSAGTLVMIPGSFDSTAGITLSCSAVPSCSGQNQATLVGLSATNIGSPDSPVTMDGGKEWNWERSGIALITNGPWGDHHPATAGTNYLRNFDYVGVNATNPLIMTFQGSISGSTLTVPAQATSSDAQTPPFISAAGRLNYPGCAWCSASSLGSTPTSGVDGGPGVWPMVGSPGDTTGTVTIQASDAYGGQANAAFYEANCDKADQQAGTYNIDRGDYANTPTSAGATCNSPNTFPTSNFVFGSDTFGTPANAVLTGADYASGVLPSVYLAAHPRTADMTPAQILTIDCLANKKAAGHSGDLGDGAWVGAWTGETDAVNHTGGGKWQYYDDTLGYVIGDQVPGCDAAP